MRRAATGDAGVAMSGKPSLQKRLWRAAVLVGITSGTGSGPLAAFSFTRMQSAGSACSGRSGLISTNAYVKASSASLVNPLAPPGASQGQYAFYAAMQPHEFTESFYWKRLEKFLGHLAPEELFALHSALRMAVYAHEGQVRKSGEPFVTHPVEVARILAEMGCEVEMLISALLHDTVEDTSRVTLEEIGEKFGAGCQRIVEGETKFSKLSQIGQATSKEELNAMDLKQLFIAMTEDARIILVKLADRLHNMRTMAAMPAAKQAQIARETRRVFAPLAGLLGLWLLKVELEDLSLQYESPEVFRFVSRHRARMIERQKQGLQDAERMLYEQVSNDPTLRATGLSVTVEPRMRNVAALYRRAKQQLQARMPSISLDKYADKTVAELLKNRRALEGITDVLKFYLLVRPSSPSANSSGAPALRASHQCYQVLAALHAMWPPVPGSIKDYISTPKQNGYQGLHSSLCALGCGLVGSVEVIVHTEAMHVRADYGIAAESWPRAMTARPARKSPFLSLRDSSGFSSASDSDDAPSAHHTSNGAASVSGSGSSSAAVYGRAANGFTAMSVQQEAGTSRFSALRRLLWRSNGDDTAGDASNGTVPDAAANGAACVRPPPRDSDAVLRSSHGTAPAAASNGIASHPITIAAGSADAAEAAVPSWPQAAPAPARRAGTLSLPEEYDPSPQGLHLRPGRRRADGAGDGAEPPPGQTSLRYGSQELLRRVKWLESIRQWQEDFLSAGTASEFMEVMEADLLGSTAFTFTPDGDIVRLPKGATVVDFAYHVHTDVGNSMLFARVNGVRQSASYELANADIVHIQRCKDASLPQVQRKLAATHRAWLPLARTQSARHKLKNFLREHPVDSSEDSGSGLESETCLDTGSEQQRSTRLMVTCHDRPGLLADVAATVAKHGLNLMEYSGGSNQEGDGYMCLRVDAAQDDLTLLREDLLRIPAITGASFE